MRGMCIRLWTCFQSDRHTKTTKRTPDMFLRLPCTETRDGSIFHHCSESFRAKRCYGLVLHLRGQGAVNSNDADRKKSHQHDVTGPSLLLGKKGL